MARRVQLAQFRDFTGGINYRDDEFEVAENETSDCLNVQIMPRGGFQRRKMITCLNSSDFSSQAARNIWPFYGNGVTQILVQDGNDAKYSTGSGTFTAINPDALTVAAGSRMRAASMARVSSASSERCYIQRNAEQVAWKWDGTTAAVLADAHGAYNDTISAPAGGKMPKAKYIVTHAGFMFHANTVEAGTAKTSRVRFSHPGEPEDYRTNDYFDVGADDGDSVTGLCSLHNQLFIFKNRSVWMLSGYDSNTFQLTKVTDSAGAVSQEAICRNENDVFFYDAARGVFRLTPSPRGVAIADTTWMWDKILPIITDHTIPPAYSAKVCIAWIDARLWVAVPWLTSTVPKRMFVWDPSCGREGAWYPYEFGAPSATLEIGPMLEWRPPSVQPLLLMTGNDCKDVFQLEVSLTATTDDVAHGSTGAPQSYFRTAWFNLGLPGVKKRFRKSSFTLDADDSYSLGIQYFSDYNELVAKTATSIDVTTIGGTGAIWGDAATMTWGSFTWGPSASGSEQPRRGSGTIGSAFAVQLLFQGPYKQWGLNTFDLRFIPKRIR